MGSRLGTGTNPGVFFDRASIEVETFVDDGRGGQTSTGWQAIPDGAVVPVEIRPLSGTERMRAMQAQADVTHEVVTSDYLAGVRAKHRLRITSDGGRILHVVSAPMVVGRKRRLTLMCREDVDG